MSAIPPARRFIAFAVADAALLGVVCSALEFSLGVRTVARLLAAGLPFMLLGWAVAAVRWPALAHGVVRRLAPHGLVLTVLLFVLFLYGGWSRAISGGTSLGGVVPYSDAAGYFVGAERLLDEGALDSWNSRRPINAVLLAVRLALAGRSFRFALLLQVLLLGSATFFAARALAHKLGAWAGALLVSIVLLFSGRFVGTALSEPLGVTLGCLSLAMLLPAVGGAPGASLACGFMALGLGLQARAGAMFTVPLLLAWAAASFGPRLTDRARAIGIAGAGVVLSMATVAVSARLAGAKGGAAQSNFAYTLYGLAKGGLGWTKAQIDYPELGHMSDAEVARLLYARSGEAIRERPTDLLRGLWHGLDFFVQRLTLSQFDTGRVFPGHPWVSWVLVGGAVTVVAIRVRPNLSAAIERRAFTMLQATVAGALLSVPIVFYDGTWRVFAPAVPFVAAYVAVLVRSALPASSPPGSYAGVSASVAAPAIATAAIAILAMAGPRLAIALGFAESSRARPCADQPADGAVVHGGLPFVRVVRDRPEVSRPEDVAVRDLASGLRRAELTPSIAQALQALTVGDMLLLSRARSDGRAMYVRTRQPPPADAVPPRPHDSTTDFDGVLLCRFP
jgi:hypothetical protein